MVISHLDNIAHNYSKREFDLAKSLFEERLEPAKWMLSLIRSSLYANSTLVDIGAGQGSLIYAAAELGGTNLIGVEPFPFNSDRNDDSPFLANASRQVFRDRLTEFPKAKAVFVDSYVENATVLNGLADIVTIFDVLEHAASVRTLLSTAYEFLKPGGLLLISTAPYYWSSQGHHLFSEYPDEKVKWAHLVATSDSDLFANAGVARWRTEAYQSLSQVTHGEVKSILIDLDFEILKENIVTDQDIESLRKSLPNFQRTTPNEVDYLIVLGQFVVRRKSSKKPHAMFFQKRLR